jgi:L-threonylcarbamoyladenylate synthase
MRVIKTEEKGLDDALRTSVETLEGGGIVAYPTETFYGLGVKFDLAASLERLHALKRRPPEKAMPLIVGSREALQALTHDVNPTAWLLMERFWPGPLTILLPAAGGLSEYIVSNGKVAVRVPGESFALRLARAAGFPLTATSANPSGLPPARDAETVIAYFGRDIDLLVDGGTAPGGLPSTVVDVTDDRITVIRQGPTRVISGDNEG